MKKKVIVTVYLLASMPVISAEELAFTYDANGNLIQDNDFVYEYNDWNQLFRMRLLNGSIVSEYSYDNEGNRYKKVEYLSGGINETTYYGNENFIQVRNSSGTFETFFYYEDDTLVARKDPNGSVYYYHPDHLGSTDIITTSGGAVFEDMDYLPFGDELVNSTSKYLYTGKELDRESDLDYFSARYYDPYLRQFIQPDTIIPDVYNPQSLNRYSYVLNNPYKYTDPTGHFLSEPVAIARVYFNPTWGNVGGMVYTLIVDNLVTAGFTAATGIGGLAYELGSDAFTLAGLFEYGPEEWLTNTEPGVYDDALSLFVIKALLGEYDEEDKEAGSAEVDVALQSSNEYTSNYDSYTAPKSQDSGKSSLIEAFGIIKDFMMANPGMTEAEASEKYKKYNEFESKRESSNNG